MADEPYTLVAEGTGAGSNVFEQKLGNHAPGVRLKKTIQIRSNQVSGDRRKVILSRHGYIESNDYYNFTNISTDINTMSAINGKLLLPTIN